MIIIGITGSIGMGKSTIALMLKYFGIPIHDSDRAVKKLLENDFIIDIIKTKWPTCIIYNKIKIKINKDELSKIIFNNNKERKKLENLIHPYIIKKRNSFIRKNKNKRIIGIDVPLLYETKADKICNYIFLASASVEIQKKRVLKRANMNIEKFNKINSSQLSTIEKKKKYPIIIPTGYGKIITFIAVTLNLSWIIIKTKSIKI